MRWDTRCKAFDWSKLIGEDNPSEPVETIVQETMPEVSEEEAARVMPLPPSDSSHESICGPLLV
jgi:hypothetical protein